MARVGVWSENADIFQQLHSRLGRRHTFLAGGHPADFVGENLDLLVISPTAVGLAGASVIQPRLALLPGGNVPLARRVLAASAVSYGLGRQNTLTLSSLTGGSVCLALQRELLTLSGATLDRQEWVLPLDLSRQSPEEFLCLTGALLLLDQPLG